MINEIIVRILAERILNSGLNPKTGNVLVLEDVKNVEYRNAVENYILEQSEVL